MAQEKRKQEAVYMKVALVALVGALGVLVAARFLLRKPAPPPAAAAKTAQAGKGKPTAGKPAGKPPAKGKTRKLKPSAKAVAALLNESSSGNSHDPFVGTGRVVRRTSGSSRDTRNRGPADDPRDGRSDRDSRRGSRDLAAQDAPDTGLQLVGIMRGGAATAVIRDLDDNRHYLRVGQQVEDYRVAKIGTDSVVLSQGAQTVTLTMRSSHSRSSRDRRSERSRPRPRSVRR